MIKFFRNIRKSLLNEGKTSKYFKYAIGEIVLVVIGILIALQINNWNTSRQESQELNGYLSSISKNIQADLNNLDNLMQFRDSTRLGAIEFMKLVKKDSLLKDEILDYYNTYNKYLAIFDVYFRADLSGFEALKNSGYLGKLHNTEIESKLYKYYEMVDVIANEESSINNFIDEMENQMFKDNAVQQIVEILKRNLSSQNDAEKMQELMQNPSYTGVNFRVSNFRTLFDKYNKLKQQGPELLSLIEAHSLDN